MNRRLKLFLIFALVLFGSSGGYYFFLRPSGPPATFFEARRQGALISQNIVELSNQARDRLVEINQLDQKNEFGKALDLTTQTFNQTIEIRNQAVELSRQIEIMTKSISKVSESEARQMAFEAISDQLAMINKLVNYSDYLAKLLDALQLKFSNRSYGHQQIATLVDQLNSEINAINNFSRQAEDAMKRLDQILK